MAENGSIRGIITSPLPYSSGWFGKSFSDFLRWPFPTGNQTDYRSFLLWLAIPKQIMAMAAVVAGHTPVAFVALPPAIPMIQQGQIRALAVTSAARVAAVPDVPTLGEAGLPGQEADTLQAVLVPAATPRPVVDLLFHEIKAIVAQPDIQERFAALGLDPVASTPDAFAAQIRREITKWGKVIHDANIRME